MAAQNSRQKDEKGSDIMKREEQSTLIKAEFYTRQKEYDGESPSELEAVQKEEPAKGARNPDSPLQTERIASDLGACPHDTVGDCECDRSRLSLCSGGRFGNSTYSSTEKLSPTHQPDPGDDCASVILTCLFCRFYELLLMLPGACEGAVTHCCPSYRHFSTSVERLYTNDDCSCNLECDCGLFEACHDTSECLELAMEVSEVCYR